MRSLRPLSCGTVLVLSCSALLAPAPAAAATAEDSLQATLRSVVDTVIAGLASQLPPVGQVENSSEPVDPSVEPPPLLEVGSNDNGGATSSGPAVSVDTAALSSDGLIPLAQLNADLALAALDLLTLDVKALNQSPTKAGIVVAAAKAPAPAPGPLPPGKTFSDYSIGVRAVQDVAVIHFTAPPKHCVTAGECQRPVNFYQYSPSEMPEEVLRMVIELVEKGWKKVALDLSKVYLATEHVSNAAVEGNEIVQKAGGEFAVINVPTITRAAKSITYVDVDDRGSKGNNVAQIGNQWGFVEKTIPVYNEMIPEEQWIYSNTNERILKHFRQRTAQVLTIEEFCRRYEEYNRAPKASKKQRDERNKRYPIISKLVGRGIRCESGGATKLFRGYPVPVNQEQFTREFRAVID